MALKKADEAARMFLPDVQNERRGTMMPNGTDYAEIIKQKVYEQLANFLLLKNIKPEKVWLTVYYRESEAKIEINLDD